MNKVIAVLTAVILGVAAAETPATPTDIDYIFGPLEIVDGLEDEIKEPEPYVYIEVADPNRQIYYGDDVTLRCVVIGLDHRNYGIQWQYCIDIDNPEYLNIDCHEREYTFTATYDNVGYYYRVVVSY